ncbi:hypothetical protein LOD99_4313 [Oopsacas minuta]|uniref:Uncharacterized protein n=1 Tax=Oopsacas minuta TaxID=111878 RepID=A0AAV7JU54_9METZ|nr:hypothetical protein LOD99_4313 [Oopsacas minuta]
MAEKQLDPPTSPISPLLNILEDLKPRYLKACSSKSIDSGNDLHALTRLKMVSSFGSDSLGDISQGDEKKIAQAYETKLKRLQQKVTDLTRLYGEFERDAENKLQFWQNKFLSTFQALKNCQASDLSVDSVQQLSDKIKGLEDQMAVVLTQEGDGEMSMHRFNKEMLSKLKRSHQEKRELVDELSQYKDKFSNISSSVETCSQKLDSIANCNVDTMDAELDNARSTIERLVIERAELEDGFSQVETVNTELRAELAVVARREVNMISERDRVSEELLHLQGLLQGRENELGEKERDNLSLIDRLEGLNTEIELLRREVEAKGRSCEENKQRIQSDTRPDTQQGLLVENREEISLLWDELLAAREKIKNHEDTLFNNRENNILESERAREIANLQDKLNTALTEIEQHKTQSDELIRKKKRELEISQDKLLESNRQQTDLLEQLSNLQQVNRDKTRSCEQLDRQVIDLSKALQACLEMQEQLVESFQIKQQDIDKLTGQASTLQRELSKSTDKNIISNTQLQSLNQRLHIETEQVKCFEKKLRDATRDKNMLQQEITQLQQRTRSMTSPDRAPTHHSYPYLNEDPLLEDVSNQMASSLPVVLPENKGSPNFSQNYRKALQKGLSQVELNESTSKLREDPDNSPDTKLYWVRRVSEMSLQMKESSEYWSAQVKQLTLQLEQAKHSDTET